MEKMYLGDAVYLANDIDGSLVLTTEDGVSTSNQIYVEPALFPGLIRFVEELQQEIKESHG